MWQYYSVISFGLVISVELLLSVITPILQLCAATFRQYKYFKYINAWLCCSLSPIGKETVSCSQECGYKPPLVQWRHFSLKVMSPKTVDLFFCTVWSVNNHCIFLTSMYTVDFDLFMWLGSATTRHQVGLYQSEYPFVKWAICHICRLWH